MYKIDYFFDRFLMHIRKVQDNMVLLEKNKDKLPFKIQKFSLFRRSLYHDLTKFSKKNIEYYSNFHKYSFCKKNRFKTTLT